MCLHFCGAQKTRQLLRVGCGRTHLPFGAHSNKHSGFVAHGPHRIFRHWGVIRARVSITIGALRQNTSRHVKRVLTAVPSQLLVGERARLRPARSRWKCIHSVASLHCCIGGRARRGGISGAIGAGKSVGGNHGGNTSSELLSETRAAKERTPPDDLVHGGGDHRSRLSHRHLGERQTTELRALGTLPR